MILMVNLIITNQTSVATFVDAALVEDHAGCEEGEGVDEDGEDADAAEQAEGAEGGDDGGRPQHERHDVRHAGHTDCHPCVRESLPETFLEAQLELLLGEVLVGLNQDEHVVNTYAEHEKREDVVELGEHEATRRANAKAEDTA